MVTALECLDQDQLEIGKRSAGLGTGTFRVRDSSGRLVLLAKRTMLKIPATIHVHDAGDRETEVLTVGGRGQGQGNSLLWDVADPATGQKLGAISRDMVKSMFGRGEYVLTNKSDTEVARVQDPGLPMRLLCNGLLIPLTYTVIVGNATACSLTWGLNPMRLKLRVRFSEAPTPSVDRRLILAAALVVMAMESRVP